MFKWLLTLMLFRLLIPLIFLKNLTITQKLKKLKRKDLTTQELNKLTGDNFADKLKQADSVSKNYIANFIKKTNFDNKLKNFNKKAALNKTRHLELEKRK